MSSLEFSELGEFEKIEPYGDTVRMLAFVAWIIAKCNGNKRLKLEDVLKMAGKHLASDLPPGPKELRGKTKAIMGALAKKKNK